MPINALPPAPQRSDAPATFITKADAFVASLALLVSDINNALAVVNAVGWVSGATYAIGQIVWSPINFHYYRRIVAGAGATDPSLDAVNWAVAPLNSSIGDDAYLTNLLYPSQDGDLRDIYRSGWLPYCFNQQWGGAQWGGLPDGSKGDVATGQIQDDNASNLGNVAGAFLGSTGFKLSEAVTSPVVWLKLYKVGNPSDLFQVSIYSDTGGSPNVVIGSGGTLSGKSIASKTDGEWYAIPVASGALAANTQYHAVVSRSGGLDASNYYFLKSTGNRKYPGGFANTGTSAPVWTQATSFAFCFLVQNPTANRFIQSGGQFDAKVVGMGGAPWNQSKLLGQPLRNFYDGKNFTFLLRGTWPISSSIADFTYGLDHDRICLTTNASGFPVVSVYRSDRTLYQVTGTSSVAAGFHDVGFKVRTVGDGADYLTLYVDGASQGTPLTAQTFIMDTLMRELGTAIIGGGFPLTPTWTQDMQMASLPSAQGWTWTGTGVEASCMSIQSNKLYQNKNGYGSTDTGYYTKTVAFVNATGWAVEAKLRVPSSTNTYSASGATSACFYVQDGTRYVFVDVNEYFVTLGGTTVASARTVQGDFKSQEHVFVLQGKGSDVYLFMDGKLLVDGTGLLIDASATNSVSFGDPFATAGENSDVVWSYVKYYQGGMLLPIAANGGILSEAAYWSGDQSLLLPTLYNTGTPISAKKLCGVERNYIGEGVVQRESRAGITLAPTTTATTAAVTPEMEAFIIGADITAMYDLTTSHGTLGAQMTGSLSIDGAAVAGQSINEPVVSYVVTQTTYATPDRLANSKRILGLRKVEGRWVTSSGTMTRNGTQSHLQVEAKP